MVAAGSHTRLLAQIALPRQAVRAGMTRSGIGALGLALDVAAVANIGSVSLFGDLRDDWKKIVAELDVSNSDVWRSFFDGVSPNWNGEAKALMERFVRHTTDKIYPMAKDIAAKMSSMMQSQRKEIFEYDVSVALLYLTSGPIFLTLMAASATPAGQFALASFTLAFIAALGNLLKQFADVIAAYESGLNGVEMAVNTMNSMVFTGGDPEKGGRDLKMYRTVTDPAQVDSGFWDPAGAK
ncbi:hypothetical protein [Sphaerisporangium rufum]|nr:hypothetical protein [Sphaerisporangium rufum]